MSYTPLHSLREKEYLFIDGGCLRASIRTICKDVFGDAEAYEPWIPAFLSGGYDKIFYYDAVSGKEHNEAQAVYEARMRPEHERFERIQALERVHVSLGKIVGKDRRQKGVDVKLAVDMMTHAFRGKIGRATLFAGDSDFVPLVKSLVSEGLHVTLWHPPQASKDLTGAADTARVFEFRALFQCLTKDGDEPAFQTVSSGSGALLGPQEDGLDIVLPIDGVLYAGLWSDNVLKVWRGDPQSGWSYVSYRSAEGDLARTLKVVDVIHRWGLVESGADWIKVI